MEKKKYPIGAENYMLYEEVGVGVSASVIRALCIPLNEVVAIKILDFERDNCDLNNVFREAQTMVLVDHPSVVKSHCSFVHDHNLWVVMPFMEGGSCLHILKAAYPDGFEEVIIATILREVLKGLEYLHNHGHIHRDVKAGNILIDSHGGIKLGDFGVSACLFDSGDRKRMRNTFVGTPCWMAPEVMEQVHGYDFKADIWSFGITALELAHGHAPFSKYPPMKVLLMTLQNAPPGLDYAGDHKFSKSFKQMIASCLVKDPSKRPTAKKLLKHSFFKQARSSDYIKKKLLDGLPELGDRVQALKVKEEEMLAQKKMPDGKKEEISQNEYKCGISSWDFNLDDLKAQAALIHDEDPISELEGSSSSLPTLDVPAKQLNHMVSFMSPNSEAAYSEDNPRTPRTPADISIASNISRKEQLGEDESITTSIQEDQISQKTSPGDETSLESNTGGRPETEVNGKVSQGISAHPSQSDNFVPLSDGSPSEDVLKDLRTPASNGELDEKTKPNVVQQKGRFKVTSVNAEPEKVPSSLVLQKSQSLQVISQHPAVSSPLQSEATPVRLVNHSLFPMLQSVLQTNIAQRDCILTLMKQISLGEPTDGGSMSTQAASTEKSLLEAAHDKEKELLREVTELQYRLICVQEELQKYKTENTQINI